QRWLPAWPFLPPSPLPTPLYGSLRSRCFPRSGARHPWLYLPRRNTPHRLGAPISPFRRRSCSGSLWGCHSWRRALCPLTRSSHCRSEQPCWLSALQLTNHCYSVRRSCRVLHPHSLLRDSRALFSPWLLVLTKPYSLV